MWHKTQDEKTAQVIYINILTKERVTNYKRYSGEGITHSYDLHEYQVRYHLSFILNNFLASEYSGI